MSGFLFNEIIFGPVKSRRLGISLGINLLPTNHKVCNYNCVYCECGWNKELNADDIKLPARIEIKNALEERLIKLKNENMPLDSITFAGNGEPSIHPEFIGIVDDVIELRNKYYPTARTTVLSNAGLLNNDAIFEALIKLDNNILKLDAGTDKMYHLINRGSKHIFLDEIVENLKKFKGKLVIQTLFLKGKYNDEIIDNTTKEEVEAWLKHIAEIRPEYVMIYPIDRATPADNLEKIERKQLEAIAARVNALGIKTKVYN
ncbi:MAG: radical SAM protein [Bacteroidetes bacterium]|nr:radical SAM protein [Bacteroidota bacterium]